MSYDMDIWNDEKDYFSDSIEIALLNASGPFYPINKYLNRDPEIIQVVEDFVNKNLIN
jgi:ABC-type sulfate transport system substrate-binding protein